LVRQLDDLVFKILFSDDRDGDFLPRIDEAWIFNVRIRSNQFGKTDLVPNGNFPHGIPVADRMNLRRIGYCRHENGGKKKCGDKQPSFQHLFNLLCHYYLKKEEIQIRNDFSILSRIIHKGFRSAARAATGGQSAGQRLGGEWDLDEASLKTKRRRIWTVLSQSDGLTANCREKQDASSSIARFEDN